MPRGATIRGTPECGSSGSLCAIGGYYVAGDYLIRGEEAEELRAQTYALQMAVQTACFLPSSVRAAAASNPIDDSLYEIERALGSGGFGHVCVRCGKRYELVSGHDPYVWRVTK